MKFNELNLSQKIINALDLLGYHEVYPMQQEVIPQIQNKQDILLQSDTGSGKTAAYGIPILDDIIFDQRDPQALILVPTRELALQVKEELDAISIYQQLKIIAVFGKSSMYHQVQDLKQRCHIICATPGRLLDLIRQDKIRLQQIRYLVIDEADEMFQLGFIEDIKTIIETLNHQTTILCSATLPSSIQELANQYLNHPLKLNFTSKQIINDKMNHYAYKVDEEAKKHYLLQILYLNKPESCIIFANTQERVSQIASFLDEHEIDVDMLHGGMLQEDRIANINDFKLGKLRILVASNVAARGIDIDDVKLIINYDLPNQSELYIHRIGRSARKQHDGCAVSLISSNDEYYLKAIQEYLKQDIIIHELDELNNVGACILGIPKESKKAKHDYVKNEVCKLYIGAGKKKKLRATDLLGAFCSIDSITKEDIGIIQIQDYQSYVTILNNKADIIVKHFKNHPIKNKHIRVTYAKD